jgi:hypothetical protein
MTQESTRLFYGDKETTRIIRKVLAGAKRIDVFADAAAPAVSMGVEPLREGILNMIKAGGKMRFLTEITKDNISQCKELVRIAEVRHLDGIKGGMAVSDRVRGRSDSDKGQACAPPHLQQRQGDSRTEQLHV